MTTHSKPAQRLLKTSLLATPKVASRRAGLKSPSSGAGDNAPVSKMDHVLVQLGNVTVRARAVGIAAGRIALPKMVQKSMGLVDAFLVRNVNNPTAPEVLVINPAALDRELRRAEPCLTLGDIVDELPFRRRGVPSLRLRAVPDQNRPSDCACRR